MQPRAIVLCGSILGGLLPPALLGFQDKPLFTEITSQVGLDFVHDSGTEGKYMAAEVMGSGGAFLDYDNDGDLDILLVQAGPLPGSGNKNRPPHRLYRQNADGTFTDVTAESGLAAIGYGTGVAVGDIDNEGLVDVFVTSFGPNALYHNDGGGRFSTLIDQAGFVGVGYSFTAAFCDYDRDGFLDLYVTRWVKVDPAKVCVKADGAPDFCSPQSYPYETHLLYHNNGNRTFTDVSDQAGISRIPMPGLGVVCSDFTGDGWPDFYVANDREPANLWVNQHNGKFVDEAFLRGVAVSGMGQPQAGMGIALGDVNGDGYLDLYKTHLINQYNTLYLSDGKGNFDDRTAEARLLTPSLPWTSFGTAFVDYDHDGDLDIVVVGGAVAHHPPVPGARMDPYWNPYAEPRQLYQNDGNGRFKDVSALTGSFGSQMELSRGLAVGDVDRDGDLDLLVANTAGPARLFRNDASKVGSWLLVRAWEEGHKRDAHGAIVTVLAGGKRYVRVADPGFSYLSSNDPRAHFGIVGASRADSIQVRWPDGVEEIFPGVALNQSIVLRKGRGKPSPN